MLTSLRYRPIPSRLKGGHLQHLARTSARRRDKGPALRIRERLVRSTRNLPNRGWHTSNGRDSLASTRLPALGIPDPVELRNSDQARSVEHGVVDDDAGSLV
jgi:hypothetical protein